MRRHGGRFQAQGDDVDQRVPGGVSQAWDQEGPATKTEGAALLGELAQSCTDSERRAREEPLAKAKKRVAAVDYDVETAGIPFIKSYYNERLIHKKIRVDLEIKRGRAWVQDDVG